jgi:hypothetical protein
MTGTYRHYEGREYEVIGVARHSETMEELVVYKALYQPEDDNLWVRPKAMFFEEIERNGQRMKRFEKISD